MQMEEEEDGESLPALRSPRPSSRVGSESRSLILYCPPDNRLVESPDESLVDRQGEFPFSTLLDMANPGVIILCSD